MAVILKYGAFLKYLDACGVACGGLLPPRVRAAARERRQGRYTAVRGGARRIVLLLL